MKKTIIAMCMIFVVIASVGFVVAGKNHVQKQEKEFGLPENAVEVAPGVFYLGKALDKGKVVEGYAFMMKDSQDKKARKPKPPIENPCYTFLSEGAKWKSVENYVVDMTNEEGLNEITLATIFSKSIFTWESEVLEDVLGTGSVITGTLEADSVSPDGLNEVYFEDLGDISTIAFTIVWGVFSGPARKRVLVEWDMVFNDNYVWGICEEGNSCDKMDFQNIATHELGHAVGLGDLYNAECIEQTMYGYSGYGDISKRTLASGDKLGIQALYG